MGSSLAPHLSSGHIQAVWKSLFMATPGLRPSPADAKLRRKLTWHKCKLQSSPWALPGRGWASAARLLKPMVQRFTCGDFQKSRCLCLPHSCSCLVCVHAVTRSSRAAVTFNLDSWPHVPYLMNKRRENKGKITHWGVVGLKFAT